MLDYINMIWNYNYWAHRKLWDSVMSISKADFECEIDYGIGSLHRHLVHTMWAERLWMSHIKGEDRINWTIEDYPTRESVIEQWKLLERTYREYIVNLNNDELNRPIQISSVSAEKSYTHYVYDILIHVVNHGTDHRAQMLRLIGDYGGQTFPQDMVYYFREIRASE